MENDLTRVEVVLHEFNRSAIDKFLKDHDFETKSDDWGRKIKLVLMIIEEIQRGIRKEECTKK
ncbi:hypothetical protein [uncultured Trichococcus sp.]|uniref:hypothetical protein n=1 Tax=uncultured Trichococcus sp. TaxID=189665 RepID=UPI002A188CEC|nr:hypothetical protein [uncultured Trichococcus sp.]